MKLLISVCGSDDSDMLTPEALEVAEEVGHLIAERGALLVCGGHGGIMRAACKGAKESGGLTIGILPGSKESANEFVDVGIPTELGFIRNYLVSNTGDVVIAINGRWGTLNEIAYAMVTMKPVVLIRGTGGCVDELAAKRIMQYVESTFYVVDSAKEAVDKAFELCG